MMPDRPQTCRGKRTVETQRSFEVVYKFKANGQTFFGRSFPATKKQLIKLKKPTRSTLEALSARFTWECIGIKDLASEDAKVLTDFQKLLFSTSDIDFLEWFPPIKQNSKFYSVMKFYSGESEGDPNDFKLDYFDILCNLLINLIGAKTQGRVKVAQSFKKVLRCFHMRAIEMRENL